MSPAYKALDIMGFLLHTEPSLMAGHYLTRPDGSHWAGITLLLWSVLESVFPLGETCHSRPTKQTDLWVTCSPQTQFCVSSYGTCTAGKLAMCPSYKLTDNQW